MAGVFRSMEADIDNLPKVGQDRNQLGARIGVDIHPDEKGDVHKVGEGLSVNSAVLGIPSALLPRSWRDYSPKYKSARHRTSEIFILVNAEYGDCPIDEDLWLTPQNGMHGVIAPARSMHVSNYQNALAKTRTGWALIKPDGILLI